MLRLVRSDEDSLHWASHSTSWLRLSPELLLLLGGVRPGSACFRQTQSAPAGRVQCTPPHCTLGQLYNMYNNENRICNFNTTRSFYILNLESTYIAGTKAILNVCYISRNIYPLLILSSSIQNIARCALEPATTVRTWIGDPRTWHMTHLESIISHDDKIQ